jgi:hypothetical protein
VSRYRCVDAQKAAGFPVAAACEAADVSTSAHYAWTASQAQGPSLADVAEQRLVAEIRAIHANSDGVYGAPRVTAELRPRGWLVNHKRVERLMAAHGLADPDVVVLPIVAVHGAQVPCGKVVMNGVPVVASRRLPSMLRALPAVLGPERVAALADQARIRFHAAT